MGFWSRSHTDGRAQVGIGTLIVFIALVLVAAVAAGVLINTAGVLQASGESTGQQSQSQLTSRIDVQSVVGEVRTRSINPNVVVLSGEINSKTASFKTDSEQLTVSKDVTGCSGGDTYKLEIAGQKTDALSQDSPHSFDVNTVETVDGEYRLEFESEDGQSIITTETPPVTIGIVPGDCDTGTWKLNGDVKIEDGQPATAKFESIPTTAEVRKLTITVAKTPGAETVAISETTISYVDKETISKLTYTTGGPDSDSFSAKAITGSGVELRESSDRVEINIDVSDLGSNRQGLLAGESVTLQLTTQSGATTNVEVQLPATLVQKSAVLL